MVLAKKMLKRCGVDVVTVDNGKEAVEKVLAGGIDLVLMDMRMPILNGFEAVGQLCENVETARVGMICTAIEVL